MATHAISPALHPGPVSVCLPWFRSASISRLEGRTNSTSQSINWAPSVRRKSMEKKKKKGRTASVTAATDWQVGGEGGLPEAHDVANIAGWASKGVRSMSRRRGHQPRSSCLYHDIDKISRSSRRGGVCRGQPALPCLLCRP